MSRRRSADPCCAAPPGRAPLPPTRRARLLSVLRALSHPTRLDVFLRIAGSADGVCVCDVTERCDVGQPTVSHHLRVLRDAGLVEATKRGRWVYYAARPGALEALRPLLENVPGTVPARGA